MSRFSGPQGKGAMKRHREVKRLVAQERNATACARRWPCGHIHGAVACDIPENIADPAARRLLTAIFGEDGAA